MPFRRAFVAVSSLALGHYPSPAAGVQSHLRARQATNLVGPADVPGLDASTEFAVKVVEPADAASDLFTFHSWSKPPSPFTSSGDCNGYFAHLEGWTASWVNLEMRTDASGDFVPVVLEVTRMHNGTITDGSLVPDGNSQIRFQDGKAYIKLFAPTQVNVDINRQFELTDTGPDYEGEPMHSFTVFANPPLFFPRPDPQSLDVFVVNPGEAPPEQFNQTTLYFAPGVHTLDLHTPYELLEGKHYYVPVDAWVQGPMSAKGSAKDIRLFGYGTLAGDRIPRTRNGQSCQPNKSPEGLTTDKVENMWIWGLTFVDFPNHHLVLGGSDNANRPNHVEFVKIFGWRANGDGVHVFMYWKVKDLFLRTQDDSLYIASCSKNVEFERVKTWNDANGASFIFTAGTGGTNARLTDSMALYTRAMWAFWAGGRVFSLRGIRGGEVVSNINVRNIKVTDPLPTMPLLDFNAVVSGDELAQLQSAVLVLEQSTLSERLLRNARDYWLYNEPKLRERTPTRVENVAFRDINVRNHSTIRRDEQGQYLPHGVVNIINATPGKVVDDLSFDNVKIGGLPMGSIVRNEDYFFLGKVGLHDVTVDGERVSRWLS